MLGEVVRHDNPRKVALDLIRPENNLPLALVMRGVLDDVYNHSRESSTEIFGHLLGFPLEDVRTKVRATYIERAVRGETEVSTATYFRASPESIMDADQIAKETGALFVGYYHSHHGHGIFLSEHIDIPHFRNYYRELYMIAVVVDPTKGEKPDYETVGLFGWDENHNPVRLPRENIRTIDKRPVVFLDS